MVDLRLVLPAAALWVTAAVAVSWPEAASRLVPVAWALTLVALVIASARSASVRRGSGLSCIVLAAGALALTSIAANAPQRSPIGLVTAAREHTEVDFAVRVDRAPHRLRAGLDGNPQWSLRGTVVEGPGAGAPVTVVAPLSESEARLLPVGSVGSGRGRVQANEPGDATTFTLRAAERLSTTTGPPPWSAWTTGVRERFAQAAATTPGDGGALLPGLAIGDEAAVDAGLSDAMKTSSLTHLTAVSGANCALVTALVFLALSRIGLGRRARVAGALVALGAFVVLVTPGSSVVRAAVMATVVLIGVARGRPAQGLPALGLAVIVMVVVDPWIARDYGFVLSVLATAGLLVLAAPLARALGRWLPRSLALALAIPIAAQLACQPVLILLSPTLPLYGVPANLLAAPAAPIATVLGCFACLLLPVVPAFGQVIVWVAWAPSQWIATLARGVQGLPGSALPWIEGAGGVIASAAVLLAVLVLVLAPGRGGRRVAAAAGCALIVGLVAYAGILGGTAVGRLSALPPDWQIAACDVGQGDGVLVRDGDAVLMIDVGRRPGPAAACLDRLGISRVDLLVLTHYDADHVGGFEALVGRTAEALVGQTDRAFDEHVVAGLRRGGARITQVYAGVAGRLGALDWRVIWPPRPAPGQSALTGNPGSVTVAVHGRGLTSIFLGDLGEEAQDALLATGAVRPVDVVKVAHHGSADQSERLYRALQARIGLVSVGGHNGYGHPTASALNMLGRVGTAIERTDCQGLLLVSPPGPDGELRVWSEHPGAPAGSAAAAQAPAAADGGRPYADTDRGGTWPHEVTRGRALPEGPPSSFRSWAGTRSGAPPSSSSRDPRPSWRIEPSGRFVTSSKPKTRASRSATSTPRTTRPASCSRSRAPPCSGSRGSSGWRRSRSATTRFSPRCSTTFRPRPRGPSSCCATPVAFAARSSSTRSAVARAARWKWSAQN
jgi:competence protein ComEC